MTFPDLIEAYQTLTDEKPTRDLFAFFTLFVCAILALVSGDQGYYRQVRSPVPVQDAEPQQQPPHYGYGYGR
uniref:SFRICE_030013 n=1 Tax=Spodoptera frugiperda TaxID=7108 RepID=A0A2H1W5L8_SPOFR